jgi:hypothetical protein
MTIAAKTAKELGLMTDLQILRELSNTSIQMKNANTVLQQGQAYLNLLSQETTRRLAAEQPKAGTAPAPGTTE